MTPSRTSSVIGYAAGSVRSAFALPNDAAAAAATGLVAVIGWAFGPANAELLLYAGIAMLLDLVVGSLRAALDPLEDFTVPKLWGGFLGKIFRAFVIPLGGIIDRTILASGIPVPSGYDDTFPATKLICLALIYVELVSVLRHLKNGGLAPELLAVVMRQLDRLKLGHEPPARRDYDVEAIVEEERRALRREKE